jgi:hypothetical protein
MVFRALALILAALTLGMAFSHVLELPRKLAFDARTWTMVNQSLYGYFAIVGGLVEIATVVCLAGLAVADYRRGALRWHLVVAACCFASALLVWAVVVQPANAMISSWNSASPPAGWSGWRLRWELGHAGRFCVMLAGYIFLVAGYVGRSGVQASTDELRAPSKRPASRAA